MTFPIPAEQLQAPGTPLSDLGEAESSAEMVAVYGKARHFHRLSELPNLRKLWLSGAREPHLSVVARVPSLAALVVHDLRASSLEALSGAAALRTLALAGSRIASLNGLESLEGLRELILFDVAGFPSLHPLATLEHLEVLCVEGGFSRPLSLPTLQPLRSLRGLRRLRLASVRISDRSLAPLHALTSLREVFIAKTFPVSQLRALAAALPEASGEWLDSHRPGAA